MTDQCEYFRELMRSALTTPLPRQQAREVEEHVAACAACGLYREDLAADDRLLADFARRMAPAVEEIARTVVEAIGQRQSEASRGHWGSRPWRVVAAVAIVCGVIAVVGRLLLPLGEPSVTLAQTLARMREAPWIHVVQTMESGDGRRYEYWERAAGAVLVQKRPDGGITYSDYDENVMHAYNPVANRVTISFTTDSYKTKPQWNPLAALSEVVERAEVGGTAVVCGIHVDNGVQVERMVVDFDLDGGRVSTTYVRDVERNLLVREETTVLRDGHRQAYATSFDYPERGPEDIYALGVPGDAAILDIRPEGPALDLVNTVQQRFERGFGDHLAVVLESRVDQDGASEPGQIAVLWQKGQMKRCDVYRALDSQRRADGMGGLYSLVAGSRSELTIAGVLEVADVNAMTLRLLYDGQRTIRWQNVGGQLVEDEHEVDQFKMPYGSVPHSLAGLIWPNLHLRLQSGSSQFKRQVRLLPEDPDRLGLVGLQFVEFAATEDYWFDPAKDYMLIERVEKQEGQGVTSRTIAVETAQTVDGRWYPSVLEIAFSRTNNADPTEVSQQELRVLVDGNPTFGDNVFALAMPVEHDASEPGVASSPAEAGPSEPNDTQTEVAVPSAGLTGWVRDVGGRPIADATVALYHNRNRWGLGNRVVEHVETDSEGRFIFEAPLTWEMTAQRASLQDEYVLLATHPDCAFGWQHIRQGHERDTYNITLTEPVSREITVTDHNDLPMAGVRVWLSYAGERESANPLFRDYLNLPTDTGLIGATTGPDGRAVIENLPATSCGFSTALDGYAYGWAFSGQGHIRLSPGAKVSGWVLTDAGDPVPGAVVRLYTQWYMHQYFLAETDGAGHFELRDLPARGWDMSPFSRENDNATGVYLVTVEHAGPPRELHLSPGETIDDLVIELAVETTLVRCLLLEEGTDMPVPGARIDGTNAIGQIQGESDANGVFVVWVLPGPVTLSFESPPDGVYILDESSTRGRRISFKAQGPGMDVVLRSPVIAGLLIAASGTICDPEGLPVEGAVVYAGAGRFSTATAFGLVRPTGTDAKGQFTLTGVPAGLDLHIYAETRDHTLAAKAVYPVPADANEVTSMELVLLPTETAVALVEDEKGDPVSSRALSVYPVVEGEQIWRAERTGRTDETGVLQIDGVVPGLTYFLRDARFESVVGPMPEDSRQWFSGKTMVLIPLAP